jgi:hypothetical protein
MRRSAALLLARLGLLAADAYRPRGSMERQITGQAAVIGAACLCGETIEAVA